MRTLKAGREKRRAWERAHRAKNVEKYRAKCRQYYWANPEKGRTRARAWYAENQEQATRKWREKRLENLEYHSARVRQWNRDNPGHASAYNAKRRHRLLDGRSRGVKAEEWTAIKEYFCDLCAYCLHPLRLERDHVESLDRGGLDEPDNIVPACKSCNCSKGKASLIEWMRRGGRVTRAFLPANVGVVRAA